MKRKLPKYRRSINGYVVKRDSRPVHWVKVTYTYVCKECGSVTTRKERRYAEPTVPKPCDHGGNSVYVIDQREAFLAALRASHLQLVELAAAGDVVSDHSLLNFPCFYSAVSADWEREEPGFRPDPSTVHFKDEEYGLSKLNLRTEPDENIIWPTKEEVKLWLFPSVELLRKAI